MDELGLLLAMVDRSGRQVAADEHEDVFEEYRAIALSTGSLPGLGAGTRDPAAAGMLDVDVFLGVGLALLGQIGVQVLAKLGEIAVEKSADGIAGFVRARLKEKSPLADAVTAQVVVRLGDLPVTAEQVKVIVLLQLEAVADAGHDRAA